MTRTITQRLDDSQKSLETAAHLLRQGGIVAFGTETVYGLGANATQPNAVDRLFALKRRPLSKPLTSLFPHAHLALRHVIACPLAQKLAQYFWPGPLTLVLPRAPHCPISSRTTQGLSTLAIRVPQGRTVTRLLELANTPIAAPSANLSGQISPSTAEHVLEEFDGFIDAIVDTGACPLGLESTLLDLSSPSGPRLLRLGSIPIEDIEVFCGSLELPPSVSLTEISTNTTISTIKSTSSSCSSYDVLPPYTPRLPLYLERQYVMPDEALLAFGPQQTKSKCLTWNLSEQGCLQEAASRLFAGIRFLDREGQRLHLRAIAVQPIPRIGLGQTIHDRLNRMAFSCSLPHHSSFISTPSHDSTYEYN